MIHFIEVGNHVFEKDRTLKSVYIKFAGDDGFKIEVVLSESEVKQLYENLDNFGIKKFELMRKLKAKREK